MIQNVLDCYGYNDYSQLVSLKQQFNEGQERIDAEQDKKIDKLSKKIGGEALNVFVGPENAGEHAGLTKEQVVEMLNISEEDFDKLMVGNVSEIVFGVNYQDGPIAAIGKSKLNVLYIYLSIPSLEQSSVVYALTKIYKPGVSEETQFGFICSGRTDSLYDLILFTST